ncbi:MAG: adenosine kinase [Acidimicrobiia bacterium]
MQPDTIYDVCGIGSALVDVLAHADVEFIHRLELRPGATVVDEAHAMRVYEALGQTIEVSGGSIANSIVGIASFGGRGAFLGRRQSDQLGEFFAHDMRAAGVAIPNEAGLDDLPTGRCIVVITEGGERTMCTALGGNRRFTRADIVEDVVAGSAITFCEGYLYDAPMSKAGMRDAMDIAHANGRRTAMTLSDPFCVDRHRNDFRALVESHIDVLFANEQEICSLYEVDDFDTAMQMVNHHCEIAVLTRGAQGAVIVSGSEVHVLDAEPISEIIDSTGAGDLYAAGFLFGITHDYSLAESGRLGAIAAAEVLSHLGARPEQRLADLLPA